jgi:dienelactone hydrolase
MTALAAPTAFPPMGHIAPLLTSPLATAIARPWLDWVVLRLITRFYFPLSRAWAAALVAEGDAHHFRMELGYDLPPAAAPTRALAKVARLKAAYRAADAAWIEAFFGAEDPGPEALVAAERAWREASHRLMCARGLFLPLILRHRVPAVRFRIPDRDEVDATYKPLLAEPDRAYAPPATLPSVERSRAIERSWGREYWLRFPSPGPDRDTAWAHVMEPVAAADAPTLIYGHGLAVELEAYDQIADGLVCLVPQGVRVIRLEAPWHVRRAKPGWYGGELFMAMQPLGALDLFQAAVREMAIVAGWARAQGSGRVAFGGMSMGALTAQLAAAHARVWPERHRPDALFLVTTSDSVAALAFESGISRGVGLPEALEAAGWNAPTLDEYGALTDPGLMAPLPPADIVMVLGRADKITPCRRGAALADHWHLPGRNLFIYDRGHFSVPIGLFRDRAPLERLAERLKQGAAVSPSEVAATAA